MSETAILEESSAKKAKRGRPPSIARQVAEGRQMRPDVGLRANINAAHGLTWLKIIKAAAPEDQRAVLGATWEEIRRGKGFQAGYLTLSEAAGRAIDAGAITEQDAVRLAADARRDGMGFCKIAAVFRRLRLGERAGNTFSLAVALCQALDRYQRQFPATTTAQRIAAARDFLAIVEGQGGCQ